MRARGLTVAILSGVMAAGCARPSPPRTLKSTAEQGASWAASARLASDAWATGLVPRRYVDASLDSSRRNLESALRALRGSGQPLSPPAADLATRLQRTSDAVVELRMAVNLGDPRLARAGKAKVQAAEEELRALAATVAP